MYIQLNRNKKKKKDIDDEKLNEKETAKIYAQFVRSFEGNGLDKGSKFVKSGKVLNPSSVEHFAPEDENKKKGKSKFTKGNYFNEERKTKEEKTENDKSSTGGKVKEIDSFLEEIKLKQKILDERKSLKEKAQLAKSEEEKIKINRKLIEIEKNESLFSYSPRRERVSNLYLGNLSAEVTEEYLCQRFGKFGKVNSVKIMYPRKDEDKKKARISGFVCFENREDAENARDALDGTEMFGNIVKVGWSKAIPKIFNSNKTDYNSFNFDKNNLYRVNANKKIEIILPEDKTTKRIIDLLAKYVTEEGYTFEETIKKYEKDNPKFTFLFNTSELFYYYKWRVFSFAQGDSYKNWRVDPFQMFENGYVYIPPPPKNTKSHLSKKDKPKNKKVEIDEKKKNKLINIINNLNRKRVNICRAMIFCTRHSDFSADIVKTISNFLIDLKYDLLKKINLVYLLSDILYNCSNQFYSSWSYRKHMEEELPRIFFHFRKNIKKCDSKIKAKLFTDSIMNIFHMWDIWAIYNSFFMNGLKCLLSNKKLSYIKNEIHDSDHEPDLDGTKIEFFDELKRYPLNLRRNAYLYFQKEENNLNRLCEQRGLYFDENFTKKKKIKYLLLYDDFCNSENVNTPNGKSNVNIMVQGDGSKKISMLSPGTNEVILHVDEKSSNMV